MSDKIFESATAYLLKKLKCSPENIQEEIEKLVPNIPPHLYEYFNEAERIAVAEAYRVCKSKSRKLFKADPFLKFELRSTHILVTQTLSTEVETYIPVELVYMLYTGQLDVPKEKELEGMEREEMHQHLFNSVATTIDKVEALTGDMHVLTHHSANFFASLCETYREGECYNIVVWGRHTCKHLLIPTSVLRRLVSKKFTVKEEFKGETYGNVI